MASKQQGLASALTNLAQETLSGAASKSNVAKRGKTALQVVFWVAIICTVVVVGLAIAQLVRVGVDETKPTWDDAISISAYVFSGLAVLTWIGWAVGKSMYEKEVKKAESSSPAALLGTAIGAVAGALGGQRQPSRQPSRPSLGHSTDTGLAGRSSSSQTTVTEEPAGQSPVQSVLTGLSERSDLPSSSQTTATEELAGQFDAPRQPSVPSTDTGLAAETAASSSSRQSAASGSLLGRMMPAAGEIARLLVQAVRDPENRAKLEELASKNPQVARYLQLGQQGAQQLESAMQEDEELTRAVGRALLGGRGLERAEQMWSGAKRTLGQVARS